MSALEHYQPYYQITDAVIENRSSHIRHTHEHHDIRWKPNAGEKPPAASHLNLLLNKKILLQYLYWCSLIPVRELQPPLLLY